MRELKEMEELKKRRQVARDEKVPRAFHQDLKFSDEKAEQENYNAVLEADAEVFKAQRQPSSIATDLLATSSLLQEKSTDEPTKEKKKKKRVISLEEYSLRRKADRTPEKTLEVPKLTIRKAHFRPEVAARIGDESDEEEEATKKKKKQPLTKKLMRIRERSRRLGIESDESSSEQKVEEPIVAEGPRSSSRQSNRTPLKVVVETLPEPVDIIVNPHSWVDDAIESNAEEIAKFTALKETGAGNSDETTRRQQEEKELLEEELSSLADLPDRKPATPEPTPPFLLVEETDSEVIEASVTSEQTEPLSQTISNVASGDWDWYKSIMKDKVDVVWSVPKGTPVVTKEKEKRKPLVTVGGRDYHSSFSAARCFKAHYKSVKYGELTKGIACLRTDATDAHGIASGVYCFKKDE